MSGNPEDPEVSYDYTSRGNIVAVISNGTAVLGLGNLGALSSKPVMEGKAVLFKRFADIDGIDLEVDTEDVDEFVDCVRFLGKSWGGINLEDIKAPECFVIEERLRECLDVPVFHDDQHGTAIIAAAALVNALHLTGRSLETVKLVCNGAGAAGVACLELLKRMGLPNENAVLCDTRGVIYRGREAGMNQWKSTHAIDTPLRTLEEAVHGADVFFGCRSRGRCRRRWSSRWPNAPSSSRWRTRTRRFSPEDVAAVRSDAIVATGRSDYPNQVNNVLGFPYIFRGALDVRATAINDEMRSPRRARWRNSRARTCPTKWRRPTPRGGCNTARTTFCRSRSTPGSSPACRRRWRGRRWTPGWRGRPIADFETTATASRRGSTPPRRTCTGSRREAQAHPTRMVVRRGRRGEGHSRGDPVACGGAGRRGADRPANGASRRFSRRWACASPAGSRSTTRGSANTTPAIPTSSTNACNAKAISAATASAW